MNDTSHTNFKKKKTHTQSNIDGVGIVGIQKKVCKNFTYFGEKKKMPESNSGR